MTEAAGHDADDGLPHRTAAAAAAVQDLVQRATARLRSRLAPDGSPDPALAEREQHAVHGLAWLATYAESLRALSLYGARLAELGRLTEMESLLVTAVFSEYL
ncbi:MAG TPA: acyl-CoA dehydrogenase, partial [Aestuariivirgaceae bacterium]|nr:acyl-CoA dehydrogenase [Aestuariivirgaceae bacterium]